MNLNETFSGLAWRNFVPLTVVMKGYRIVSNFLQ